MKKKKPVHLPRMVVGLIATAEATSVVRLSSAAKRLREIGATEGADELERDAKIAAPWCQKCGRKIDDPVVGILGDRVAFACPWCSSPEVLAAWEQEGGAS